MVLKILAFGPGFRTPSDSTADPELSVLTHTSSSRPTPWGATRSRLAPLPPSSTPQVKKKVSLLVNWQACASGPLWKDRLTGAESC